MFKYARIQAVGSYLPSRKVTNHELAKKIDTSDEWIRQRTGISERYIASEEETALSMAKAAARQALERAFLYPQDIDYIIVATCTHHKVFPSLACLLQNALEIPACTAFDIQAACGGFVYAMQLANMAITTGQCQRALVVGSETMSKVLDWKDRTTCVLFGDGAGACILETSEKSGVLASHLGADGSYANMLYINNAKMSNDPYLRMSGRAVFKCAVSKLGNVAHQVVKKAGLTLNDIDWVIPHQANIRIIEATVKKLQFSMNQVILTVAGHANTSAASIPLALNEGIQSQKIQRGQILLLEAFGGGFTWGAMLVQY